MKLNLALISALMLAPLAALHAAAAPGEKPNILFILTDDQGWATLSCQGNKLVATPHLDALARDGARFTDAYVMPQCTPTRAALLTGQHTARSRMWHVIPWYGSPWARMTEPAFAEQLPRDAFTLPKGFRAAGYKTGMAGKWHLTTGTDGDYVSLKPAGAAAYGFDEVAPPGPGSHNAGDKWVDYLTDAAVDFIERHRAQPWFFYLAHHTLHGTVAAPGELVEKYRAKGAPAEGLNNATYLAAIEHLDDSVGRLLGKLDELNLRGNTLVVFLSDNGGVFETYDKRAWSSSGTEGERLAVGGREFSNAPLRAGKGSAYEGGLRVPLIVRWPGVVKPETVNATPVHVVDWLPTLLAVAGAKPPADHVCDGVNLVPLLRGEAMNERALFWHMPLYDLRWGATPCSVVRRGEWKLIEHYGDRYDAEGRYQPGHCIELFNLHDDLGETRNLAESQPEKAKAMDTELRGWLRSLSAEIPAANPRHDAARQFLETRQKPTP